MLEHRKLGFGSQDARPFGRRVVVNRAYLFRKNFPQTPLARLQFFFFVLGLIGHRLINREWRGARGAPRRPRRRLASAVSAVPITFVSSHAHLGGEERYLLTLLEQLGPEWVREVVVLEDGPLLELLDDQPVTVIPTSRRAGIAFSGWRLRRHLRRQRPALVHANGVKAALVCALAGVPFVWLKHDFSWDGRLARFVGQRSRLVVGVSSAVTETFAGTGIETDVVLSGIGAIAADRSAGRARLLAAIGPPEPGFVAAIAARLDPTKGHAEALAALPEIHRHASGFRLVILGGEHEPHLQYAADLRRRIADEGLESSVTLLGHREDAIELLSGCDAVLVPSVVGDGGLGREGFSLTALEGMAVGTPVIGYDHGGLPEVLGDCGLLVPPGDREALAAAILRLVEDGGLRERLARCGVERAASVFALPRFVEEMKDRYRRAAKGGQGNGRR